MISARGLQGGIEPANKIRAPALLVLLLILVGYALATGDVRRGLTFAFKPDFSAVNAQVVLSAIGQAFYATGVGQAMMIAFGAYIERGTSLVRTSLVITGSILAVSLLATMMIFPLVFGYGMNPAQGPALVFDVLPRVFTEMPGGRLIGTFVLSAAGAGGNYAFHCAAGAGGGVGDVSFRAVARPRQSGPLASARGCWVLARCCRSIYGLGGFRWASFLCSRTRRCSICWIMCRPTS